MNFSGLRFGVYRKTIKPQMASETVILTFLHTSFAKIFCQNYVKKNRKFAS